MQLLSWKPTMSPTSLESYDIWTGRLKIGKRNNLTGRGPHIWWTSGTNRGLQGQQVGRETQERQNDRIGVNQPEREDCQEEDKEGNSNSQWNLYPTTFLFKSTLVSNGGWEHLPGAYIGSATMEMIIKMPELGKITRILVDIGLTIGVLVFTERLGQAKRSFAVITTHIHVKQKQIGLLSAVLYEWHISPFV